MLERNDRAFANQARLRLEAIRQEIEKLANGTLTFNATETWRSTYQDVLEWASVRRYLSVALIETDEYWQSEPDKHSLQFNFHLVQNGYYVARICIVDDFLWPPAAACPARSVCRWVAEQHQQGIEIHLVRLAEIRQEAELCRDFGIYGESAVGYQLTDEHGLTTRYEIHFDPVQVRTAEELWKRLLLYATHWDDLEE